MDCQIRHADLGLFQGNLMGIDLWTSQNKFPEGGIRKYSAEEDAQNDMAAIIEAYTKHDSVRFSPSSFSIEPFDREEDEQMIRGAFTSRGASKIYCDLMLITRYHPEVKKNFRFN